MTDPWTTDGTWLRCALHAHTTCSDGELAPKHLARHYARAGYDVLAVTDHWRITDALSKERLLVVPSVELNCILAGARDGHVLAFGVAASEQELRDLAQEHADLEATANWIEAHGGVAYLAHPYWTGVTAGTLELPENVTGIEVFNAGCELEVGRGLSTVHWDELLEAGRLCPAIAADDSHHPGFDSDLAWTWLRAPEPSRVAILEALVAGTFYSSTGPLLYDVRHDGDAVEVRCSPSRSVTLVSGRATGAAVNVGRLGYRHAGRELECDHSGLVVHARLEVPRSARHVRVEVTDAAGRKAWANPIAV
jgi:alkylhydroperoxidase family enzyme